MNRNRVLVFLVLADIVLAFSSIGAEMFFGWTLPGALQDYAHSQIEGMWSGKAIVLIPLWAITVSLTVAAWIALLNLWWFGRRLYVTAWLTWLFLVLLSGPSVTTGPGAVFSTLESVVGGTILGLCYFSELSRHFERPVVGARVTA